jgi:hypothetical protein
LRGGCRSEEIAGVAVASDCDATPVLGDALFSLFIDWPFVIHLHRLNAIAARQFETIAA